MNDVPRNLESLAWAGDPPIPSRHIYLSTACYHDLHEQCGRLQHGRGDLDPPHCKYCPAPCVCDCHS